MFPISSLAEEIELCIYIFCRLLYIRIVRETVAGFSKFSENPFQPSGARYFRVHTPNSCSIKDFLYACHSILNSYCQTLCNFSKDSIREKTHLLLIIILFRCKNKRIQRSDVRIFKQWSFGYRKLYRTTVISQLNRFVTSCQFNIEEEIKLYKTTGEK